MQRLRFTRTLVVTIASVALATWATGARAQADHPEDSCRVHIRISGELRNNRPIFDVEPHAVGCTLLDVDVTVVPKKEGLRAWVQFIVAQRQGFGEWQVSARSYLTERIVTILRANASAPWQSIGLDFKKFEVEYQEQTPGGRRQPRKFGWDVNSDDKP